MSQRAGGRGRIGHWQAVIEQWALGIDTLGIGTWQWIELGQWAIGAMRYRGNGYLGQWAIGAMLGQWAIGAMRYWGNGLLGQWAIGAMLGHATLCASGGGGVLVVGANKAKAFSKGQQTWIASAAKKLATLP